MPPRQRRYYSMKPHAKETLCPCRTSKNNVSLFSKLPAPAPEPDVPAANQPLAERMRPRTLDEFIGQEKLLGPGKSLRVQIENDNLGSMLFWGPPGCGKTTLARLIARLTSSEFVSFSAVLAGIKEIKDVMAAAERQSHSGHRTIVFVDEVHRFNKAQQDAFLPYVEAGHITFIDARTAYNILELAARGARPDSQGVRVVTHELLEDILQRKLLRYDKAGEEHYNLISALHKSVRNSDP